MLRKKCWFKVLRYVWQSVFNRVLYHRTILGLFVQCWLGSLFTNCGTIMNRGWHWNSEMLKISDWKHLNDSIVWKISNRLHYVESILLNVSECIFIWNILNRFHYVESTLLKVSDCLCYMIVSDWKSKWLFVICWKYPIKSNWFFLLNWKCQKVYIVLRVSYWN